MLQKIIEYWQSAVSVAGSKKSVAVWVLVRIILCRLINGFGPKDYLLFSFHRKPFFSHTDYLKKAPLEALQNQVNPMEARQLALDKFRFYQRCKVSGVPTPEVFGVLGEMSDGMREGIPHIRSKADLLAVVESQGEGVYLLKPVDGSHGSGIIRFHFVSGALLTDSGEELSAQDEFVDAFDSGEVFLLQRALRPHPELTGVMPGQGLGTVRLVTAQVDGQIEIVFGCLKIPVGNNIADNFLAGKSGNLLAEIDIKTGQVKRAFGPDEQHSEVICEYSLHPDSGVALRSYQFPYWADLVAAVKSGAQAFHELKTIGWDAALTEQGPCLIEANSRYDCDLLQVAMDRGLKAELTGLLGEIIQSEPVRCELTSEKPAA